MCVSPRCLAGMNWVLNALAETDPDQQKVQREVPRTEPSMPKSRKLHQVRHVNRAGEQKGKWCSVAGIGTSLCRD